MDNSRDYDKILRKKLDGLFGNNVKHNSSICSTCKHFNGNACLKGWSYGGFVAKLDECAEWEVCNG